jgi:hypothetical protein
MPSQKIASSERLISFVNELKECQEYGGIRVAHAWRS